MKKIVLLVTLILGLSGLMINNNDISKEEKLENISIINKDGKTIKERFNTPNNFIRVEAKQGSFAEYLRNIPVKQDGEVVRYYNGDIKKNQKSCAAVIDLDVGKKDLQQCADAVMRLRGEYLYENHKFDSINFNLTNGFKMEYLKWIEGYRVKVDGNKTEWVKKAKENDSYENFREFMEFVFIYAGTMSLSNELESINAKNIEIGDVIIEGGHPGHAVIVVDKCFNENSNKELYLLAQSYMPAQNIHVLTNLNNLEIAPWYDLENKKIIKTPEWEFDNEDIKRFKEVF